MLKLIRKLVMLDVYQFENGKRLLIEWNDNKPHVNHPTPFVAQAIELQLKRIGRQNVNELLQ